MKKVVLAFSGGLDTTFSVLYLKEQGFKVITMTVDTGYFTKKMLMDLENKSKQLGAVEHYEIDGKDELFEEVAKWTIMAEALYEGSYPNLCADRYLISKYLVKLAEKMSAEYVAHGSTSMGNDQVRFDTTINAFNPNLKILSPIKEMGGNRKYEAEYIEKANFMVPIKHTKYSINPNMLGITYSGNEIDLDEEPSEEMFTFTKSCEKNEAKYFEIEFSKGLPVSIDGKKMKGSEIIMKLNNEAGKLGFGKSYYTGDCIIGIKGHIVFEAPALFLLIKAHLALKQYVLTKSQISLGPIISKEVAEILFGAKVYDPIFDSLKAYLLEENRSLNGIVMMKVENGDAQPVSVKSPNSLIDKSTVLYAQSCSWTKDDADGFIKLYGMQTNLSYQKNKKGGAK